MSLIHVDVDVEPSNASEKQQSDLPRTGNVSSSKHCVVDWSVSRKLAVMKGLHSDIIRMNTPRSWKNNSRTASTCPTVKWGDGTTTPVMPLVEGISRRGLTSSSTSVLLLLLLLLWLA